MEADTVVLTRRPEAAAADPFFAPRDLVTLLALPQMRGSGRRDGPEGWARTAARTEALRERLLGDTSAKTGAKARAVLGTLEPFRFSSNRNTAPSPWIVALPNRKTVSTFPGSAPVQVDDWTALARQSAINRTENLIHGFAALAGNPALPRPVLAGGEHLEAALRKGRGAVLWVGHFSFGSFMGKVALANAGFSVSHVSRPQHGFSSSRFSVAMLNGMRCAAELKYLKQRIVHERANPKATAQRVADELAQNGLVSFTAGAWEGRNLVTGPFLSGRLSLATGAPAFAVRAACPLLPVFVCRGADGVYTVFIEPALEAKPGDDIEIGIGDISERFLASYAHRVGQAPDQWRSWGDVDVKRMEG